MMKPKKRLIWVQLHVYISCFFLPAAMLYAITGGLYLVGIEGGDSGEYEYWLELENGWPEDKEVARKIVSVEMERYGHGRLPNDYYLWEGKHDWFDFKREVFLIPEENNKVKLEVHQHDIWRQLLFIHKGHAGTFLKIFGILWGVSLLFSLLSGVILALNLPKFKKSSIFSIACGFTVLLLAFVFG